jgi:hypothetical protein
MNSESWIARVAQVRATLWDLYLDSQNDWTARLEKADRFAMDDEMQTAKRQVGAMAQSVRNLLFSDLLIAGGAPIMRDVDDPKRELASWQAVAGFRLRYPRKIVVPDERRLVEALLEHSGGDIGIISTGATGALAASPWKIGFIRARVDHSLIESREQRTDSEGAPIEPSLEVITQFAASKKGDEHGFE